MKRFFTSSDTDKGIRREILIEETRSKKDSWVLDSIKGDQHMFSKSVFEYLIIDLYGFELTIGKRYIIIIPDEN